MQPLRPLLSLPQPHTIAGAGYFYLIHWEIDTPRLLFPPCRQRCKLRVLPPPRCSVWEQKPAGEEKGASRSTESNENIQFMKKRVNIFFQKRNPTLWCWLPVLVLYLCVLVQKEPVHPCWPCLEPCVNEHTRTQKCRQQEEVIPQSSLVKEYSHFPAANFPPQPLQPEEFLSPPQKLLIKAGLVLVPRY